MQLNYFLNKKRNKQDEKKIVNLATYTITLNGYLNILKKKQLDLKLFLNEKKN